MHLSPAPFFLCLICLVVSVFFVSVFVFVFLVFVLVFRNQTNQLVTHLSPAPLIDQEFPFLITRRERTPPPPLSRQNFNPTTEEETVSLIKGAVRISRFSLVFGFLSQKCPTFLAAYGTLLVSCSC